MGKQAIIRKLGKFDTPQLQNCRQCKKVTEVGNSAALGLQRGVTIISLGCSMSVLYPSILRFLGVKDFKRKLFENPFGKCCVLWVKQVKISRWEVDELSFGLADRNLAARDSSNPPPRWTCAYCMTYQPGRLRSAEIIPERLIFFLVQKLLQQWLKACMVVSLQTYGITSRRTTIHIKLQNCIILHVCYTTY